MKKILSYIFIAILSSFIGAYLTYVMISKDFNLSKIINNNSEKESIINKNVTIVDNGISEGIENIYDAVVVIASSEKEAIDEVTLETFSSWIQFVFDC